MKRLKFCLLPIEKVAAVYCALTCVLMLVMMPRLVDPEGMLLMRVEWLALTLAAVFVSRHLTVLPSARRAAGGVFLRVLVQLAWLAKWYPDTYEFNRSFQNLDHVFAAAEQQVFGCQPALEFSQALPSAFWSEAFNLGYWSYFPMIAVLVIVVFIMEWRSRGNFATFQRVATTIIAAFFLYYFVYIFLPVTGPQFYFQAVGIKEIAQGHFPALGTYFSTHTEMLPSPGWSDGLFYQLVDMAHEAGERPTAAFPSSHIGISTIVMLLSWRHAPKVLPYLLPLWALLCCATVYIQAHYLIDSIAGLLTAPLALWCSSKLVQPVFR